MTEINGLPAHVLLVHVVVVLIPLSALLVVLVAVWPAARQRLDIATAALAVAALASVPLTTEAGDWLEHRLPRTPLLRIHTHLGDTMLPWAIALAVVALVILVRNRRAVGRGQARAARVGAGAEPATVEIRDTDRRHRPDPKREKMVSAAIAVLAVVIAVGSVVTVYRIGDSGARAAWTGQFSQQPVSPSPGQSGVAPS
jgi:hypothetical protein